MTSTQLVHATNVVVAAAPPAFFYPDAVGAVITQSVKGYNVITDSPGYAPGSVAQLVIEIQVGGNWQQFASVGGYGLGSFTDEDTGLPTSLNHFTVTLTSGLPAHSHIRLRCDSIPAGTLASLTVNQLT